MSLLKKALRSFTIKIDEELILRLMTTHFGTRQEAEMWYDHVNPYLSNNEEMGVTPRQMVEDGKGEELLDWVSFLKG